MCSLDLLNGQTPQLSGLEIKNQEEINSSGIFVIEDRINENIQRTFSELLKAKIYFDKTLTSLNSIVSEKGSSTMDSSNCICQICSNVLVILHYIYIRKNIVKKDSDYKI